MGLLRYIQGPNVFNTLILFCATFKSKRTNKEIIQFPILFIITCCFQWIFDALQLDKGSQERLLPKESQERLLPKDVFLNRFTWFCFELRKFFKLSEILVLILLVIWGKNRAFIYADIIWMVLDSKPLLTFLIVWLLANMPLRLDYSKWNPKNTEKLAQQVLELNPGADIRKWNVLAHRLNIILYRERRWGTPYFFFDGQHARQVFVRNVLKSFFKGNLDSTKKLNEIQASRIYLQTINEDFEFCLKNDVAAFASKLEWHDHIHPSSFLKRCLDGYIEWGCLLFPFGYCMLYFLLRDLRRTVRQTSTDSFLKVIYILCGVTNSLLNSDDELFLHDRLASALFSSLMIILNLYIAFRLLLCNDDRMSTAQGIEFLALIVKHEPRNNLARWDEVAKRMNEFMKWYQFIDGKDCWDFYKKYFEPLSYGKSSLEYGDLRDIVARTQPYVN